MNLVSKLDFLENRAGDFHINGSFIQSNSVVEWEYVVCTASYLGEELIDRSKINGLGKDNNTNSNGA